MSDSRAEFEAWWMEPIGEARVIRCETFDCGQDEALTIWQAARKAALEEAAQNLDDLHASARGQHNYFKFAANELRSLADRSPT